MIEIHFVVAHGEIRAPSIIVIDQGIPLEPAAGRRPGRRARVALQRTAADVSGVAQIATRATTAQSTALARRRLPQRCMSVSHLIGHHCGLSGDFVAGRTGMCRSVVLDRLTFQLVELAE